MVSGGQDRSNCPDPSQHFLTVHLTTFPEEWAPALNEKYAEGWQLFQIIPGGARWVAIAVFEHSH